MGCIRAVAIEPVGAAIAPSRLSVAMACPAPLALTVKMPGAVSITDTFCGAEDPVLVVTTTTAVPLFRVGGAWALICVAETKNSGAGMPLKVTEFMLPSAVGRGVDAA